MRSRCRWALCPAEPQAGERYCERHKPKADAKYHAYSALYDQKRRTYEPQYRAFYGSTEWRTLRDEILGAQPICTCGKSFANHVHHITPLKESWEKRLDKSNLSALCPSCHSALELKQRNQKGKQK